MNIPAKLPDWTALSPAAKLDAIRPLWDEGKSANEISRYFVNATRNSIISALSRGKMVGRGDPRPMAERVPRPRPTKPRAAPKPRKPLSVVSSVAFVSYPDAEPPSQSVLAMIAGNRPPLAGTTPVDILALPNRPGVLCRFPVIGGYCGMSCGDKMYCTEHHAIMYRETDKLRMPKEARL